MVHRVAGRRLVGTPLAHRQALETTKLAITLLALTDAGSVARLGHTRRLRNWTRSLVNTRSSGLIQKFSERPLEMPAKQIDKG